MFLSFVVLSCSESIDGNNNDNANGNEIYDTNGNNEVSLINSWELIGIKNNSNETFDTTPIQIKIYLNFFDSLNVECNGGCNTGKGIYFISADTINIECGMTKMACRDSVINHWENIFRSNLFLSKEYKFLNDTLILISKGEFNLYFKITENLE